MNRRALRLARPGQLPAPATGDDSLTVLTGAIDALACRRTAYWLGDSAVHLHVLASLIARPSSSCPRPSTTPATRNLPGPRSANSSAQPPPPQHAATGTSHDQLDKDHRHKAAMRYVVEEVSASEVHCGPPRGTSARSDRISRRRSRGVGRCAGPRLTPITA
jgi:hypothetical protein